MSSSTQVGGSEARQRVDEFMVPGRAVVLDLAGITFLDSMTLHWLVELADATGEPVQRRRDAYRVVHGEADRLPTAAA